MGITKKLFEDSSGGELLDGNVRRANDEHGFRWYTIEGVDYVSVTTVLDVICDKESKDFFLNVNRENYDNIMSSTSALGTKIHDTIQAYHEQGITDWDNDCAPAMVEYLKMVEKHNIKPIWHEKTVYSKVHGFAGAIDMLAEIDGKMCVVDIKTGKFSFKHGFQVAAYRLAAIEMGLIDPSVGSCLLYVHRRGEKGRLYTHKQFEFLEQRFLECLGLHRGLYPNQYRKLEYKWKWETPLEEYFQEKFGNRPLPEDFGLSDQTGVDMAIEEKM